MAKGKRLGIGPIGYFGLGDQSMLLWLYRLWFLPVLLLAGPYYLLRMRRRGGYRRGLAQRFGAEPVLPPKRPGVRRIWLHAVSVGEMLAIGPILDAWQKEKDVEVYLTTTTSTGRRVAEERYAQHVAGYGYFPLDWWPFSVHAWRRVQPDLVILTEGERWPEHIHQAKRRKVPVMCINARLSDRSFRRMRQWRWAVAPVLMPIARLLPASVQDSERFQLLGMPAERITVTGNIKLDVSIPQLDDVAKARLRHELGLPSGGLVLMGSSTWPGEEAALVEALRKARALGLDCSLLLVPRHAERRRELEELLRPSGFSSHFRSRGSAANTVDIAVGDTTGEMRKFLQLADVVFVGKSLLPHTEGQTPVESAVLGRPLIIGPGMGNFRVIAEELVQSGAAVRVPDAAALTAQAVSLLQDEVRREILSAAARDWHRSNTGAMTRTLAAIRAQLDA
jgi:3-deoxy-D-manno-octulosonic-acid transferase